MTKMFFIITFVLFPVMMAHAQHPAFLEPGGLYIIYGDDAINTALADQNNRVEVATITDNWIEVRVNHDEGRVWLNLEQVSVIISVQEASASQLEQLRLCLREVATLHEIHYIDFGTYTNLAQLFKEYDTPQPCSTATLEAATLEESLASEDDYKIIGRIRDSGYILTPAEGVQPLR